ncbi:hypothetical protein GCM10027167_44880 [Nocardia heshunensis]
MVVEEVPESDLVLEQADMPTAVARAMVTTAVRRTSFMIGFLPRDWWSEVTGRGSGDLDRPVTVLPWGGSGPRATLRHIRDERRMGFAQLPGRVWSPLPPNRIGSHIEIEVCPGRHR